MSTKSCKATFKFKDADFLDQLDGITPKAEKRIASKSLFGEYFSFEVHFDAETGEIAHCRQVKAT